MAEPLISVVIPTYGRPAFLQESLASVAAQSYRRIECIVVDDCSPTPVEPIPVAGLDLRVLRHERNQGPGGARNTGLAAARGDFITFLDDDDVLHPARLEWAIKEIGAARMHAVRAAYDDVPDSLEFRGDMRRTLMRSRPPQIGQVVMRTDDCVDFDAALRVTEDIEWWIRMRSKAVFVWRGEVGIYVRRHDEVRKGASTEVRYQCRKAVLERHQASLRDDRRSLASMRRRVASGALLAGRRPEAIRHAIMATLAWPSSGDVRLIASALKRSR